MTYYAEINDKNLVVRVLLIPEDQAQRGNDYLANDMGLGGKWLETRQDGSLRRAFCSIGWHYDPENDIFYDAQPYPSWTLDENKVWHPPTPAPKSGDVYWDETQLEWVTR